MPEHVLPAAADFPHHRVARGPAATAELGRRAAALLRGGEILLLYGSLGAGKTCFVQGLCDALGVREEVVSPTFTLVNTYTAGLRVHHLDLYRIDRGDDLNDIGVPDLLDEVWDGDAVLLVEWPDPLLPVLEGAPYIELLAAVGDEPDERVWHLRGAPGLDDAWRDWLTAEEDGAC
jgi:tRNA threonylcarbamoyladenosine biosynthesis protein TsaE